METKVQKWFRIGNYECPTNKMSENCKYLGSNMNNNSKENVSNKLYPSRKKVNIFYNPTRDTFYNKSLKKTMKRESVLTGNMEKNNGI